MTKNLWLFLMSLTVPACHASLTGELVNGSSNYAVKIRTGENLRSLADANSLADILSLNQVDEVYLLMKSEEESPKLPSGHLFYPGRTAPVAPGFENDDRIAHFIARCHEKNIRVLAWLPVMKDALFWQTEKKARAHIVDHTGTRSELRNWLSPFSALTISHTKAILTEIIERYPIDGVVFDYMRFDSDFASVDDFAVAIFEMKYGTPINIANLHNEAKHSQAWKNWVRLRADRIADVAQSLVTYANDLRPKLRIGITVLPFSARGYDRNTVSGQDYRALSRTGINFLSILGYWDDWSKSPRWVTDILKAARRQVKNRCDIVMSIDGDMSYRATVETWQRLPRDHHPILFYFSKWTSERLSMLSAAQQSLTTESKQYVTIRIDTEPDQFGNWDVPEADFHRLLDLFDELDVKATWVTVGKFAETRPDIVRTLYARGHEVALHGWEHERFEDLSSSEDKYNRISKGLKAMAKLGVPISGFGAPQNAIDKETRDVLLSLGFSYDGSIALDPLQEQFSYLRSYTSAMGTIPVIPFIYPNDYDALVVMKQNTKQLFQTWRDRLNFNYSSGRPPFVLDVHQWLIGQEKYLGALKDFILYAQKMKDVEFVTLQNLAAQYQTVPSSTITRMDDPGTDSSANGALQALWQVFLRFLACFPSILALQYIVFAVLFRLSKENRKESQVSFQPRVSVFVPAHNEQEHIRQTLSAIMTSDYTNFDVTLIDDGSRDKTASIAREIKGVSVIEIKNNKGKAHALNYALKRTSSDVVVCIDADTIIEKGTLGHLVQNFANPEIAAVTGNPQIRNQKGFLRKLQTMEYATIISIIKRAESLLGGLYTVSGAICGFRRKVLEDIGGWNEITQTEDIDISWRLQKLGYYITYASQAVCWISVPGTFRGLFRQRVRWCRGSGEAYRNHMGILASSNTATMPIIINGIVSTLWTISIFVVAPLLVTKLLPGNQDSVKILVSGLVLLHVQSAVGLTFDQRYNSKLLKYFFVTPFFLIYFWVLVLPSFIYGFLKGLLGERTGTWIIERS